MKRWIVLFLSVAGLLIVSLVLFVSPLAKWYIEKHSKEWTGRQITIGELGLNFFTGGITVENLKIFERDRQDVFFQAAKIYVNLELFKAIGGGYDLIEITIQQPSLNIIQHHTTFNFDDLVERFAGGNGDTVSPDSSLVKYWIRNISIADGAVSYINKGLGNEVKVLKLDAASPLIAWDNPQQRYTLQCSLRQGGDIKSVLDIQTETLNYTLRYDMKALNLDVLYPYLKDYINVGEMKGNITTGLTIKGNFNESDAIAASGLLDLRELSITDPNNEPLVTLGSLAVVIDTLNVKADLYQFGSINVHEPFLKFERFETESNFSRLVNYASLDTTDVSDSLSVQVETGNVFELMASYIQELSEKYVISNYKADSVILKKGTLIFNDYTLHNKFNYFMENLSVKAEGINSKNQKVTFYISSVLNTSGNMKGEILVNPNGFRDMEINYAVTDLKISDFNPYADYYVAHPFLEGVCYYTTKSSINNRFLKSENKLEVRKIVVGKKAKNNTAVDLPIRFAVALLRDVNGNVAVDIPVQGNLDDPKYRLGPVIWQIFKNLILKAVAAPGKLLAKRSGVDEKYLEGFEWKFLQTELDEEQKKSLDATAAALMSSSDMNIEFIKGYNTQKELDLLALQESKKRFLFFHRKISSEEDVSPDEEKLVESIPPKDSVFNAYVDGQLQTQSTLLSIFDKSKRLVGQEKLQNKLTEVYERREAAIRQYLTETKGLAIDRFRIIDPTEKKDIPYESPSRTAMNFYLADDNEAPPDNQTNQ